MWSQSILQSHSDKVNMEPGQIETSRQMQHNRDPATNRHSVGCLTFDKGLKNEHGKRQIFNIQS